jgi:orotidine-5'-phosphate decarboxylase
MKMIEPPICVALDVPSLDEAMATVDELVGSVPVFKVGLELFASEGPRAVKEIRARGADVFLDLKINDIPVQSAGAVRAAARAGVGYLTVHSNAGRATVRAACEAAADGGPKILVVTVLTSLDDTDMTDLGIGRGTGDQVAAMAQLATECGATGLVLSASEVAGIRRAHPDLFLVTPGIRPAAADVGDQRRVGTPGAAVTAGADLLVIGRPITAAAAPSAALRAIVDEINQARGRAVSKAGA